MIDLTITAHQDGTGPEDGMRLGELEATLRTLRQNGGQGDTLLTVATNRAHRVRTVGATVDPLLGQAPDGGNFPAAVAPAALSRDGQEAIGG